MTTVVLADGSRLHPDLVVLATGYSQGLEPLIGHLGVLDEKGRPVERGGRTARGAKGLWFTGYTNPISGMLRELSIDARKIALAMALRKRREIKARPQGRLELDRHARSASYAASWSSRVCAADRVPVGYARKWSLEFAQPSSAPFGSRGSGHSSLEHPTSGRARQGWCWPPRLRKAAATSSVSATARASASSLGRPEASSSW